MTREETIKVLSVMRAAYPKFYTGMRKNDLEDIVSLWSVMFEEPYQLVSAAVRALIASDTKGFPPAVGQVKEKIRLISQQEELTELEAWGLVYKAVQNGIYGYKKEFDKLPPLVQKTLGSASQLRDWAMLDESEVQSVIASNFQRSYRVQAKRENEFKALPGDVREFIGKLSGNMGFLEE